MGPEATTIWGLGLQRRGLNNRVELEQGRSVTNTASLFSFLNFYLILSYYEYFIGFSQLLFIKSAHWVDSI